MRDKELIELIDKNIFKTDEITYDKKDLVLYNNIDPMNVNYEEYILNILNQLLALNINNSLVVKSDIEKLNAKYEYLGYKIVIFDEKPKDYDFYGSCVFKDNREWTEYFNIIGEDGCLFIHHIENKKINYSKTYSEIKSKTPIFICFEKIY